MSARVKDADEPRVRDIMRRDAVTVGPEATVKELADLLRTHDIRGVPVVDKGRLVGVVTEGDIVAQDADLHFPHYIQFLDSLIYLESTKKFEERLRKVVGASVRDIMTAEVITTCAGRHGGPRGDAHERQPHQPAARGGSRTSWSAS